MCSEYLEPWGYRRNVVTMTRTLKMWCEGPTGALQNINLRRFVDVCPVRSSSVTMAKSENICRLLNCQVFFRYDGQIWEDLSTACLSFCANRSRLRGVVRALTAQTWMFLHVVRALGKMPGNKKTNMHARLGILFTFGSTHVCRGVRHGTLPVWKCIFCVTCRPLS